ncbi:hypothetical protein NIA69_10030 [Gemmiger formicilis]|nr:hypothetical protein [Gemmiger formicilis]
MQLEQQENFTIHGPQLEILGEVETKLPAPAKSAAQRRLYSSHWRWCRCWASAGQS